MENPSYPKIEHDLRQSEKWAQYLAWLGWVSVVTKKGINIEIIPTKIGGFVKIQRPRPLFPEDLEEIEEVCRRYKSLFIKVEPGMGQGTDILEKDDYVKSYSPLCPPSTIYIDLKKSEEELFRQVTKTTRYSIKKSQAYTGFFQRPEEDKLKDFYRISAETAKRQGFSIQSFADLKKKAEVFGDECWLALSHDSQNNLLGGKFFLAHKNTVWYLHAASSEAGRKADSGDKMMWDSFLYFKNLGYEVMDLDGIDDPRFPVFTKNWGGFSFFKEKLGGYTVRFPHSYIKYLNPVFKFLDRIKRLPL